MATKIAFIKASVIRDVCDRVDYISNPDRQRGTKELKEKLLAFHQTTEDPTFWKDLSRFSQGQGKYHKGKAAVEAREYILQISNGVYKIAGPEDHQRIAKEIAEGFKTAHGVECAVAVHMNDDVSDYHAHIIFPERRLQSEIDIEGIFKTDEELAEEQEKEKERKRAKSELATRNTYFDEAGKRSTKANCTDEYGDLKKGCRFVRKGERLQERKFGPKISTFATREFLNKEKERQAKYMTELCKEYGVREKWIRYDNATNVHLALCNLKRGEPARLRAWKERKNEEIRKYNRSIDYLMATGALTEEAALEMKRRALDEDKRRIADAKAWRDSHDPNKPWYVPYYEHNNREIGFFEAIFRLAVVILNKEEYFRDEGEVVIQEKDRVKENYEMISLDVGAVLKYADWLRENNVDLEEIDVVEEYYALLDICEDAGRDHYYYQDERKPDLFSEIEAAERQAVQSNKERRVRQRDEIER